MSGAGAPYLGGSSDSFWRKAKAFVPETEISEDPLSRLLVPSSLICLSAELSIHKNNTNIDLMVSRWSKDTHTFVFPWEDGGPTLQDTAVLLRLSTRGSVALDPSTLSSTDARLVDRLRRAYTEAGKLASSRDCTSRGFLMAFCFEHFPNLAPSPADISGGDEPRPRIMRWSGVSSTKFPDEGITVTASALVAFSAACPEEFCVLFLLWGNWLRALCEERQGDLFLRTWLSNLDSFINYTLHRRNLDSFINYVHGIPEIPALSDVYHRDVSLKSPKVRQTGWRGKKSYWASSSTTPAASRGVTIAEPISTVIPPSMTSAKAKEKASSQQQGLQLKRLRKGAPTRAARTPYSEETPASVASVGSLLRHEGKERTHSNKCGLRARKNFLSLKRKKEDEEAREGHSDSSIDDTAPISRYFKLPRTTQSSPGGTSVVAGKKVVIDLTEGESDGADNNVEGGDGCDSEEVEDSDADSSEGGQSDKDGDDEGHSGDDNSDDDPGDGKEGNGAKDENDGDENGNDGDGDGDEGRDGGGGDGENLGVDTMHPIIEEDEEDDKTSGLIPLKSAFDLFHRCVNVPPAGDLATHSQAHDAAVPLTNLTSAEVFTDLQDDSLISLGTPQVGYVVGDFGEGSSSIAGGSMLQQQAEAAARQIEEIRLTVQNFDKLGFDIWWVYKELDAARIMIENEKLWRHCEGAKAALEEARMALARARDAVVAAEAVVEERKLIYERMTEEVRLGI
ncbi:hypothetical protein RHSIM_Rhsim03G0108400 [Rhododendron simsii]|uniref:Aminotransferase-like plant mobile domain-containing protein n=1 Tax=Rhododendron simsii TaxID=118357 RepID=A0A834LUX6_RHOSS|nr:hypothetical protein RHSIM_Rhsim03G0108400 [Rhododendron simsii]